VRRLDVLSVPEDEIKDRGLYDLVRGPSLVRIDVIRWYVYFSSVYFCYTQIIHQHYETLPLWFELPKQPMGLTFRQLRRYQGIRPQGNPG
jgi:hypothetical protein